MVNYSILLFVCFFTPLYLFGYNAGHFLFKATLLYKKSIFFYIYDTFFQHAGLINRNVVPLINHNSKNLYPYGTGSN
ncbi:MAG: hypothetical protein JWP37_1023 [Mucilaginibacter sp.]|nr:hypothetical protein [Mucilaginibacter sp.]